MRTILSRKTIPWPELDKIRDVATRAFGDDLGRLIADQLRTIYSDIAGLQTAPDLVDSLPTASVELRGRLFLLKGAAGVADELKLCIKNAADAYEFKTVTIV